MKNKKIITVIATVAVLSTLIVSCGKSENDESKTANSTNTVTSTDTTTSNSSKEDSKENDSKDKEQFFSNGPNIQKRRSEKTFW